VETPSAKIVLFRSEAGALFALEDRCPHFGAPLSAGIQEGPCVICAFHGWRVDLASGEALPPNRGKVRLAAAPALRGTLKVELRVAADGAVTSVRLEKVDVEDEALYQTLQKALEGWRFPAVAGGQPARVEFLLRLGQ